MSRGFTVVELLITLIVMAILLTLGVVNLRSTLANGRDTERQSDIEVIARGLEQYYKNGNPFTASSSSTRFDGYPGLIDFNYLTGTDYCESGGPILPALFNNPCDAPQNALVRALPGVSIASITPPDISSSTRGIYAKGQDGAITQSEINQKLQNGYYIYSPLRWNGASKTDCDGYNLDVGGNIDDYPCTSYTLQYKQEATGQIIEIKSKHQQ